MPQFTTTVIAVAFILLAVGAVIGLLVLLYDWLAPLISRTTHGVSLPDSIGDLVSRLRRRRSRDDEDSMYARLLNRNVTSIRFHVRRQDVRHGQYR